MSQSYCVCDNCGKTFDISEIGLSDMCLECLLKTEEVTVTHDQELTEKMIKEIKGK